MVVVLQAINHTKKSLKLIKPRFLSRYGRWGHWTIEVLGPGGKRYQPMVYPGPSAPPIAATDLVTLKGGEHFEVEIVLAGPPPLSPFPFIKTALEKYKVRVEYNVPKGGDKIRQEFSVRSKAGPIANPNRPIHIPSLGEVSSPWLHFRVGGRGEAKCYKCGEIPISEVEQFGPCDACKANKGVRHVEACSGFRHKKCGSEMGYTRELDEHFQKQKK